MHLLIITHNPIHRQKPRQTLNPGWARNEHFFNFSSFSYSLSHFFLIFLHFLPQFGPLGGRVKALTTPLYIDMETSQFSPCRVTQFIPSVYNIWAPICLNWIPKWPKSTNLAKSAQALLDLNLQGGNKYFMYIKSFLLTCAPFPYPICLSS